MALIARLPAIAVGALLPLAVAVIPAHAMGGGDGCNPWNVSTDRQVNDFYTARWITQVQSDDADYSGVVYEAKAAIAVYSPWVSQGLDGGTTQAYGGSDVSEWVMIDQDPSTTADRKNTTYFQAGWQEYYQGHRYNFVEIDVPGQPPSHGVFQADAINTTHWWDVKFNQQYESPTTQPMYVFQHDSDQPVWWAPPSDDYQFIPNEAELSSETHATADQGPGGTQNHSWMGYLQIGTEKNTSLHIGSSNLFTTPWYWWGLQTFSDNSMQIWDDACPT